MDSKQKKLKEVNLIKGKLIYKNSKKTHVNFIKIINNNKKNEFSEYKKNGIINDLLNKYWRKASDNMFMSISNLLKIISIFDLKKKDKDLIDKLLKDSDYNSRAYTLYSKCKNPTKFLKNLTSFKLINKNNEMSIYFDKNNNSKRIKELQKFKKIFSTAFFIRIFKIYESSKKNKDKLNCLRSFCIDLFQNGSPYNPIGSKKRNNGTLKIGPIYDGLLVQWKTQGNNNNKNQFRNIRQRPTTNKKWVSNKNKFKYILDNWEKACDIIKTAENEVINPLRKFLSESGDIDDELIELKELIENIYYEESYYTQRAYFLHSYLYERNADVYGYITRTNIGFITLKGDDGTFLSPIYALYFYIKNRQNIENRKSKKKNSKKVSVPKINNKKTKSVISKNPSNLSTKSYKNALTPKIKKDISTTKNLNNKTKNPFFNNFLPTQEKENPNNKNNYS
jgi:hypothetical protein